MVSPQRLLPFVALAALASFPLGCASHPGPAAPTPTSPPHEAPAERRTVEAMVIPVPGGYQIDGVTFVGSTLPDALLRSTSSAPPNDPQWFVGAIVRISSLGSSSGTRIESAELITHAGVLEGELQASKGFFSVDRHLLDRSHLEKLFASRGGAAPGDRVRLWGQPRIERCNPGEQCLVGRGSLPLFDVARAEKLP